MELMEAIKTRRSIRKFKKEPVPKEVLEDVIKKSLWAPSGMNTQPWTFVVVTGNARNEFFEICSKSIKGINARLRELFNDKMVKLVSGFFKDFGGAPAVVVALTEKEAPESPQQGNLQSTVAAVYNLCLIAHEEGLGTCWMTAPLYVEKEILDFFNMPDKKLVAVIPIGYPDQNPPVPPRKHENILWIE